MNGGSGGGRTDRRKQGVNREKRGCKSKNSPKIPLTENGRRTILPMRQSLPSLRTFRRSSPIRATGVSCACHFLSRVFLDYFKACSRASPCLRPAFACPSDHPRFLCCPISTNACIVSSHSPHRLWFPFKSFSCAEAGLQVLPFSFVQGSHAPHLSSVPLWDSHLCTIACALSMR